MREIEGFHVIFVPANAVHIIKLKGLHILKQLPL